MANVAEKARFHLERAVPQLREFEEKDIFTKDEIRTLVSKRTEFEHLVLGPGCKPHHFQSYVAWELSLDKLRAKRCLRKKIKHSSTSHASSARVFSIYERAVLRHPASLDLWADYLDYAARAKATKRWRKVMTRALRMHPVNPALWARAGRRAARDGDMEGARGFFMRGCRFCNATADLWLEYARVEMEWLARMEGRKKNKGGARKGLEAARAEETVDDGDVLRFDGEDDDDDDQFEDNEILPDDPLADEHGKQAKEAMRALSDEAITKLEKSPALQGAIPRAVFDVARKQPFYNAAAAEAFFDLFAGFPAVSAQPAIIQHVLDAMAAEFPRHPATCACVVRQPLVAVDVTTAEFPRALREVLARLKAQAEAVEDKAGLAARTVAWIRPILKRKDLDDNVRTVLEHTRRKLENP